MNTQLIGLLLIITVSVLLLSLMQGESKIIASQVVKNVREFDLGEKMTIYETTNVLNSEEIKALEKYALAEFFQSDLPETYKVQGQRDLQAEQDATPQQVANLTELNIQTEQEQQVSEITGVSTSELTARKDTLGIIERQVEGNVYIRGSIIKIVGKIEMERPTPYFYNVNITCCGMDSFRALSAYETDAFGNFIIKFATTTRFPLGDWTVTISTIGDDNKIIKHFYNFKLLAPPD